MSFRFLPGTARDAEKVSAPRRHPRLVSLAGLPWLTLAASCFALVASSPQLAADFEWQRALASAEPWRLLTGHFSHWTADHLHWDLAVFAVFGGLLEMRTRRGFLTVLTASAAGLGLVLPWVYPEMGCYRGLSGIDCALACALGALRLRDPLWIDRLGGWAILGFVVVKAGIEWLRAETLFVDQVAAGFVSLPAAHVVGGLIGAVVIGVVGSAGLRLTPLVSRPVEASLP